MSNKFDSLGDRMKGYESVSKTTLVHRCPVIIRLDGKAFHTFTRGFKKPFDRVMITSMQETTKYLCENIQGCVFGYTQSDEITLILCDYQTITTSAWFDYEVQKLCSVAASMATLKFNQVFRTCADNEIKTLTNLLGVEDLDKRVSAYERAINNGAMFDARCFNVPVSDVTNCVLWRQKDAIRNSIQSLGQSLFSQRQLDKMSCNAIKEMLIEEKGVYWEALPTMYRHGSAVIKVNDQESGHSKWVIDNEMPLILDDRNYIESRINFE